MAEISFVHVHLSCGCWLKLHGKPRLGHLVKCSEHCIGRIRSRFELDVHSGSEETVRG